MYYQITLYFNGMTPQVLRVKADTATGALLHALAQDWTHAERKAFLCARVDKEGS